VNKAVVCKAPFGLPEAAAPVEVSAGAGSPAEATVDWYLEERRRLWTCERDWTQVRDRVHFNAITNQSGHLAEKVNQIQNGTIDRVEVRAGVPRRVIFESRLTEG